MGKLTGKLVRWGMRQPGAAEEIVGQMRGLSARSTLFDGDLAMAQLHVAGHQLEAEQYDEALVTLDEIVALHDRGHRTRRRLWRWVIVKATWLRALVAYNRGEYEIALSMAEDAAARLGTLAADVRRFEGSYAVFLGFLADCYHENGRADDAVRTGERAAEVARRVHARGGDCDIAGVLVILAMRLHGQDRDEEAVRYCRVAVNILRRHPNPPLLASTLINLAVYLQETRQEEALAATDEAIAVLGDLMADDSAAYEPKLDQARRNRAIIVGRRG